jgi:cell division protein FtsL
LKKKAGATHRNMVNLDIKVSKWKTEESDASQEMKDVLRKWRNKVAGEPGGV